MVREKCQGEIRIFYNHETLLIRTGCRGEERYDKKPGGTGLRSQVLYQEYLYTGCQTKYENFWIL